MKMKVAIFTDTHWKNKDGVVRVLELLKREFPAKGVDVVFFCPSPDGKKRTTANTFYFPSLPFPPYPEYKIALPTAIEDFFQKQEFDLIHAHGIAYTSIAAYKLARKFKIPAMLTFHTNVAYATHYIHIPESVAWHYLKWLFSHFAVVTTPSEYSRKILENHGIKAITVPVPVDLEKFSTTCQKKDYLLHVGRVVKEKDIDFVFPFIKELGLKLIVVGKGPALEYYKRRAKETGADVRFLGFVPDDELRKLYCAAQGLVFSSKFDTFGLVAVEALASGTAVIARKNTAAQDFSDKLGTTFWDLNSFEKAVRKAKEISKEVCKRLAKNYEPKKVVEEYIRIYKKLLT